MVMLSIASHLMNILLMIKWTTQGRFLAREYLLDVRVFFPSAGYCNQWKRSAFVTDDQHLAEEPAF